MRRSLLVFPAVVAILLVTAFQGQSDPNIAGTDPRKPEEERLLLKVPPGFEVQLVASEPDIHKPLNLNFDDKGRLWVTDTVEYPKAVEPGKKGRDTVKILEDFGTDGKARKITTFADGLNIPIGVLPLSNPKEQSALVFSIPAIRLFRDTKGVGKADTEQVLYKEYGQRDTHGLTSNFVLGLDGWVYAEHGFSNDSTVKGADGKALSMSSGNTYRYRSDGSHLEAFTRGQVNPFGLCFDPLGNLYSADCHSQPVYQLLQGGYYPSFGKPHDGLGYAPEMTTDDHGSTAISGIVYYAADHFPAAYLDTIFIGNVVTCRITLDRVVKSGSSPKAVRQPDFLVSGDPWFRPVDIKLGPDGALYVADFYNRIIGHYEVPLDHPGRDRERGRIWRIVYKGTDGKQKLPPLVDFTKRSVAELVQDLGSPNMTVRYKATTQLVERGGAEGTKAVKAAMSNVEKNDGSRVWQRVHGLYVLERTHSLDQATLADALKDPNVPVRVHALRVLANRGIIQETERTAALRALKDADADVERNAAVVLGHHPAAENVRGLLDLRHSVPNADTHLLHVVRMALRDQFVQTVPWSALNKIQPTEKDMLAVADVALGVATPEAARFLMTQLPRLQGDNLVRSVHHIARHGTAKTQDALLTFVKSSRPTDLGHQAALLNEVDRGTQERGGKLDMQTQEWALELTGRLLASKQEPEARTGIEMVARLRLDKREAEVIKIAKQEAALESLRLAALTTLSSLDAKRSAPVLAQVLASAEAPLTLRENAANLLARANQPETLAALAAALPIATARMQTVIAAGMATSPAGADLLLKSVEAGKASARLLQERAVEVKLNDSRLPDLKTRVGKLTQGLPPAEARVQQLIEERRKSFLAAKKAETLTGAQVFEKNCMNCHQIGGKGARIGPNLDGIGIRGLDRLLEDTLDPNRNVDQAFRTTILNLKSGQVFSGLLLKEEGEVLVLADAQGKEVRVEKKAVEERFTTQVSPMPADLATRIPETDFNNLITYLLAQRAK